MELQTITNTAHNVINAADKMYKQVFSVAPQPTESQQLLAAIDQAYDNIRTSESRFNEITDAAMIDYMSYDILAAKAKYAYLLKLAKEKNLHF